MAAKRGRTAKPKSSEKPVKTKRASLSKTVKNPTAAKSAKRPAKKTVKRTARPETVPAESSTKTTRKLPAQKIMLGLSVLLLAFAVGYFSRSIFVAATVNGSPITRYELVRQLEKENGRETLDNLVTKKLILQEARRNNVNISSAEIDEELQEIKNTVEEQGSTIEDALAFEGKTMQHLRDAILMDKTIEKIFGSGVEVTDEEVLAYFEENKEFFGEQDFEEVKDRLKENLFKQEVYNNYSVWLSQAREDAKVNYFINF
jgi:hypothetical protein